MTVTKHLYEGKDSRYFSTVNTGILPLLPQSVDRVLEIGCGEGNTLTWVKKTIHANWIGGVELNTESAEIAAGKLDWVMQGDIEAIDLPFDDNSIDLVLCLDVLEHLVDPWAVVKKLTGLLSPGGCLLASIPNIRHHSVMVPLLLRGEWTYRDKDVLDRTHLRFFTRSSAVELLQAGGLTVDDVLTARLVAGSRSWLANLLTCGVLREYFVFQYLIKATKE